MMDPIILIVAAIFAPVTCGVLSLMLPRTAIGPRVAMAVAGPVIALLSLGVFIDQHSIGAVVETVQWMPAMKLNLAFNPDHLGLFFALLVSGIGLLIVLYARAYFGPDKDSLYRFYPSLLLFMTAMIGVALADNYMLLLLFWEMTSISSFLLIGWERDQPGAVRNAMQAFVVTATGGLAMMAGLILLGIHTGHWTFSGLLASETLTANTISTAAFLLIFAGAAAKSAQFPLHFWLPGAMAAPTPVSAYLHSATMVKAGVYLTGRLWPIMAAVIPMWPKVIVPLGALTMVYGAFIALQKTDLKKIFAYTTVSQLGLLMCMYGLAHYKYHDEPNLIWDVTQILNHALYKAPLFILAGAIGHIASRELPELRGFFHRDKTAKIMTVVLLLAAYGLAAGPLTVSFTAKEMFFYQIYHALKETHNPAFWALVAAGVATGMFNVAIFIRLCRVMLAKPDAHAHDSHDHHDDAHGHGGHGDHHHETGLWPAFLWIPGAIIVSFQFIGGAIPGAYEALFGAVEPSKIYFDHFPLVWDAHLGLPLYMSAAAVVLGVSLGFSKLLSGTYEDVFDKAYPGFYHLTTKVVGPNAFGVVQTGHGGFYIGAVAVSAVLLFGWSIGFDFMSLRWPSEAKFEPIEALMPGYMLTFIVCFAAILLPTVTDRASRVLVLGAVGFSVTGVYFLFKAPDLALTQVSIEIVSLILFLLVLSQLPDQKTRKRQWVAPRLVLSVAVGLVFFWLTLTSATANRPTMPYTTVQGHNLEYLGEFFLRNSYHAVDLQELSRDKIYGGVVEREMTHGGHGKADGHGTADGHGAHGVADSHTLPSLHSGGGGNNVVNVILVDFRGFDTMGEIAVLGLAALGVWTLLRRRRRQREDALEPPNDDELNRPDTSRLDIPDPTGGEDPEDQVLSRLVNRSTTA